MQDHARRASLWPGAAFVGRSNPRGLHAVRWTRMVLTQTNTVWLLVVEPIAYDNLPPLSVLWIPFLLGRAQGLRYLGIIRTDERIRFRILTWLMMPLTIVMDRTWFRWLRWYDIPTCAKTGWGTRRSGADVSLAGTTPTPATRPEPPAAPMPEPAHAMADTRIEPGMPTEQHWPSTIGSSS
ncbi:hypothetical protein [Streptomyces minutiscleroticus]|uniref:hypothetical protein n=1 Tax=Streptomyces minutiscleroticus TaxID=68238 RepID=UPI00333303CC